MPAPTAFEEKYGFARSEVTLANWRIHPFNRWAFQNVAELVPSAEIRAAGPATEPAMGGLDELLAGKVTIGGGQETVAGFLERSSTDAFVVMKRGRFVGDYHAAHMAPGGRHLVFSISKSLTAVLAGSLQADGLLDPAAPVTDYVPEARGSAYGDATVQHVLDMTVSLDFEEVYLDPDGPFARYRKATLWNPGESAVNLLGFILTIRKAGHEHGEIFRYRSPNSDMLGIIIERASGRRYAELMSERVWQPLGARRNAHVTVDREGAARSAGGVSVAARDLARIGEMMRCGGTFEGRRIVPESWVRDTLTAGSAEAWSKGDFVKLLPQGRYRNKWYQTGHAGGAFCAIGIHGQWLYVDPAAEIVLVKQSSQPEPLDDALDAETLAFFRAVTPLI